MLETIPVAPSEYSAMVRRSDGHSSRRLILKGKRRIEKYVGDQLRSILIADEQRREIRSYDVAKQTFFVTAIPDEGLPEESATSISSLGAEIRPEKEDFVSGRKCTCFQYFRQGLLCERNWFDEESGLCVLTQTYDMSGKPVLRIEWSEIVVGPPDSRLFEPLGGFEQETLG